MKVFVLDVSTAPEEGPAGAVVGLRLADGAGVHLAGRDFRLADEPASLWEALFDTRAYVERFAGSLKFEGAANPPQPASFWTSWVSTSARRSWARTSSGTSPRASGAAPCSFTFRPRGTTPWRRPLPGCAGSWRARRPMRRTCWSRTWWCAPSRRAAR